MIRDKVFDIRYELFYCWVICVIKVFLVSVDSYVCCGYCVIYNIGILGIKVIGDIIWG